MIRAVVECAARETGIVHGRDVSEGHVADDPREECVEALGAGTRLREERSHLPLPNLHPDSYGREVRLDELLDRVAGAPNGEKIERQRLPAALADPVGARTPAGRVEERVGEGGVEDRLR